MRLSDLTDFNADRTLILPRGAIPGVARAVQIEPNDIIVGARGLETSVCIANAAVFGAYISLDLYLVRPKAEIVNPRYLAAFLALPDTQAQFTGGKQGSSLTRLPKEALEKTMIPLPSLHVQSLIAEVALLFEEEDKLLKQLTALNATLGRETIARAIQFSPGALNDHSTARRHSFCGLAGVRHISWGNRCDAIQRLRTDHALFEIPQ